MQNLAKRSWGNRLNIKQASEIMISWCVRAREKNVLMDAPPTIFHAYVINGGPDVQFMSNVGRLFKYGQNDLPIKDRYRDSILRCLSVALKAHHFLFKDAMVVHEPYFFSIPSLEQSGKVVTGLVYKLELKDKKEKTVIVCKNDLKKMFDHDSVEIEFPVVVRRDSFKWYALRSWGQIGLEAESYNRLLFSIKENAKQARTAQTKEELARFADILEIPYEVKDQLKPLGVEWSKDLKTWYLPKGFDLESVSEFLEFVQKAAPKKKD